MMKLSTRWTTRKGYFGPSNATATPASAPQRFYLLPKSHLGSFMQLLEKSVTSRIVKNGVGETHAKAAKIYHKTVLYSRATVTGVAKNVVSCCIENILSKIVVPWIVSLIRALIATAYHTASWALLQTACRTHVCPKAQLHRLSKTFMNNKINDCCLATIKQCISHR